MIELPLRLLLICIRLLRRSLLILKELGDELELIKVHLWLRLLLLLLWLLLWLLLLVSEHGVILGLLLHDVELRVLGLV